jgi:hypothetical protein
VQNFTVTSSIGEGGPWNVTINVTNDVAPSGVLMTLVKTSPNAYTASCTTTIIGVATNQCRFNGLNDGIFTVTPTMPNFVFTPTSRTFTISGAYPPWQYFTAAFGHTVSGTISGPLPSGIQVVLGIGVGTVVQTATTDANGNYSFTNVPDGGYTITPQPFSGYTFLPSTTNVVVSGSDQVGMNFSTILPANYTVSGQITGAPNNNAGILLTLGGQSTFTGSGGTFSFSSVNDQTTYTLTPQLLGCTFQPPTLSVPVSGANVTGLSFIASCAGPPGPTPAQANTGSIGPAASGAIAPLHAPKPKKKKEKK